MGEFKEGMLRLQARIAALPDAQVEGSGREPMTREQVQNTLGEDVALAWDDLRAARKSYSRAVERMIQKRKETDDDK